MEIDGGLASSHPCLKIRKFKPTARTSPPETTAGDLSSKKGELILFRGIGHRYVKGTMGGPDNYIKSEGNAYSYSLAPNIVTEWGSMNGPDLTTIIAIQNIHSDSLRYPTKKIPGNAAGSNQFGRPRLKPKTKVSDIIYFEEVKVPVEKENVLVTLPLMEFRKIVESFGSYYILKGPYDVMDLMSKVLASPLAQDPLCKADSPKAGPETESEDGEKPGNATAE
ncbi:MAG: hypothetical protein ACXVBE_13480 [Bdellovibrionota bacterium]